MLPFQPGELKTWTDFQFAEFQNRGRSCCATQIINVKAKAQSAQMRLFEDFQCLSRSRYDAFILFRLILKPGSGANIGVAMWQRKSPLFTSAILKTNYLAHEYCPLFNHRTKDDGGKTAMRSCVMTQNWLLKNTKPLKDASPIKYAWPVAKFTRVRSLLRQTRRSKLWVAPALERSSSRFAVYTMCAGCVRGKKPPNLSKFPCTWEVVSEHQWCHLR